MAVIIDYQTYFVFLLLSFFSLLCYPFFFNKLKDSRVGFDLPPSPPSLPIVGHLHLLLSTLTHKSLQKLSSKYGPLLHLRIFHVPVIFVSSASVAYEIFRAHDVNISFRGNPPIEESLLVGSSGFFTAPYGEYWKFIKKVMVTKLLGPQALQRSRGIRADELERFYMSLLDKAMKKESVEIGMETMKLINNSICKMIMGRSFSEENGEAERIRGLVTESTALTKKIFMANMFHRPLKKLGISLFKKEIMGVSNRFNEVLERILEEHEEKLEEDQDMDMMGVLLAAYRDKNAECTITRNHIKSLFVAPTLQDMQLRHPREGCKVGGFYVPENTPLVVNAYAMMRDPDSWEEPNEFKPERFLGSGKEDEREYGLKYIPFGSGRRGCPGVNLAYILVGTAIGVMAQCFDWKIKGDKVNMEEARGALVLTMAHPLKCIPVARAPY
ncbi:Cytochrome P450 [Arabidopsis suecica]|uniref:Cytochrome P450 n=1 Tax=Arabidopsis suecica TaxID=45249 RepID=A0A8T2B5V8_ARASU|nr:Cytochrome P450 [Arabidopsis suecica]